MSSLRFTVMAIALCMAQPAAALAQRDHSPAYAEGFQAARAYGAWFRSQQGEYGLGVFQGGMRASIFPPTSKFCGDLTAPGCHVEPCAKPGESHSAEWLAGCEEAERRKTAINQRSWSDAAYSAGNDAGAKSQLSP